MNASTAKKPDNYYVDQVFGRLTVTSEGPRNNRGRRQWWCQCSCGAPQRLVSQANLAKATKPTQSCGCFSQGHTSKQFRHGHYSPKSKVHIEYRTWKSMIHRCTNPTDHGWDRYGGRGITVCQRWMDSFDAFIQDMGPIPNETDCTLDRINSNGNYEPSNCRWASKDVQANNTRSSRLITAFGKTQTLAQWSREYGVYSHNISSRIDLLGWDAEKAISTPTRATKKKNGKKKYEPFVLPF